MPETITLPVQVTRHGHWPARNEDDTDSFTAEIAYKMGEPAVKVYLKPEQAREIQQATGSGFRRDEPFESYSAQATFRLFTAQNVQRANAPGQRDRVNNKLSLALVSLEPKGRRAA